jgi:tetratricopeptide (TPR) repeat protein
MGRASEAEAEARASLASYRARRRPDHPDIAEALGVVGEAVMAQDRASEALPVYREAVDIAKAGRTLIESDVALREVRLARCQAALGDFQRAEQAMLDALEIIRAERGPNNRYTVSILEALADLNRGRGSEDEASRYDGLARAARDATSR